MSFFCLSLLSVIANPPKRTGILNSIFIFLINRLDDSRLSLRVTEIIISDGFVSLMYFKIDSVGADGEILCTLYPFCKNIDPIILHAMLWSSPSGVHNRISGLFLFFSTIH